MFKKYFCALVFFVVISSPSNAQVNLDLNAVLKNYLDKNGNITEAGRRKLNAALQKERKAQVETSPSQTTNSAALTSNPQRTKAVVPPRPRSTPENVNPPGNDFQGVLLLRDAYSYAAFLRGDNKLSDNGASLSFAQDNIDRTRIVAGKGALLYAFHNTRDLPYAGAYDDVRLQRFAFVPGVEWDVRSKNAKESGLLSARAGLELKYRGWLVPTEYLTTKFIYTTDVEKSETKLYNGEIVWEPVSNLYHVGVRKRLRGTDILLGFYPSVTANYVYVGNAGSLASLTKDEDYLWIGPAVDVDISFAKTSIFHNLSFYTKYRYMYETLGSSFFRTNIDWFEAGTKMKLIEYNPDNSTDLVDLSLQLSYTRGTKYQTLESADDFFVGLKLKLNKLAAKEGKEEE
ncbi:MAG: hypothetical protein KF835_06250 [Xanthobacteraceae bacterium]|nr:hypothetical protein [Xanthobacteraceae bacterium]